MNRARSPTEVATPRFVEPTSVTVVASRLAASVAATCPGSVVTGVATIASSASATASARDGAASSTAPRSPRHAEGLLGRVPPDD